MYFLKIRLLEDYYSGKENPSKSLLMSRGIHSPANFRQNLGCFIFFMTLSVPFVFTSYGRSLYWKTWIFGTVFGYFWLGIRSVS